MDTRIHLGDQGADAFQVGVRDRIGCVWAEGHAEARVMLEIIEQRHALAKCFVGVASARNGKIHDRDGDLCAYTVFMHQLAYEFRIEVHVGKKGDTALQLLAYGEFTAGADEIFIHPFVLRRPDALLQPASERQVIGQATKQGHRSMAVSVDQAWREKKARKLPGCLGDVPMCLLAWCDQRNAAVANTDGVIPEYDPGRFYRDKPRGEQQQIERVGGGCMHMCGAGRLLDKTV